MFAYICGKVVDKKPTGAILDVGGIGYELLIPVTTYEKLPPVGENVKLYVHYYVREDSHALYGFYTIEEKDLFLMLIGVSGIGPKMAITILSGASPEQFKERIASGDIKALTLIPGIGTKTAQRIIVELREKFASLRKELSSDNLSFFTSEKMEEVFRAMVALGYGKSE
ncbi:MAG: Holliday junction branch migration protein RuvA, partial [Candidatus Neomarinimicrobiota bacterium]